MSLLIGIKNTTSQTVPALGAINIGSVYRRYCKKNQCGFRTFEADTTESITSIRYSIPPTVLIGLSFSISFFNIVASTCSFLF